MKIKARWQRFLGLPVFYNCLQNAIGIPRQRAFLVREFVRPRAGDRILDIGCGTADILTHLEHVGIGYTGIEPNTAYVAYANRRWNPHRRYEFQVGAIGAGGLVIAAGTYDIALAFGVMHHLSDTEVGELMRCAARGLKKTGRLVTMDPCRLEDMNLVEKFMVRYDRGTYIRDVSRYEALIKPAFGAVHQVVKAMNYLPYRAVVFVCEEPLTPPSGGDQPGEQTG